MKRVPKRAAAVALVALLLVAAFAGGYFTRRYQSRQEWLKITEAIRDGRTQEYIDGGKLILKETPAPEGEEAAP